MSGNIDRERAADKGGEEVHEPFTFAANSVRLNAWQWVSAAAAFILLLYFTPQLWANRERFEPERDYRVPYLISSDYWHMERWTAKASREYPVVAIGDSVIWGQYVKPGETLTAYLNDLDGKKTFANLGVDGLHPAAMLGLVENYMRSVSGKGVILNLNFLWMTSREQDLTDTEPRRIQHPELLPQFFPKIKSYDAPFSERVPNVLNRYVPAFSLLNHVETVYFDNFTIRNWMIENPWKNPLDQFTAEKVAALLPANAEKMPGLAWNRDGEVRRAFDWVDPDGSFQWECFKSVVRILQARNNHVFVLVSPFNTYMMEEKSVAGYEKLVATAEEWLKANNGWFAARFEIPSETFADASHPVNSGYEIIARELMKKPAFKGWLDHVKDKGN